MIVIEVMSVSLSHIMTPSNDFLSYARDSVSCILIQNQYRRTKYFSGFHLSKYSRELFD